jgi:hypothetical protein
VTWRLRDAMSSGGCDQGDEHGMTLKGLTDFFVALALSDPHHIPNMLESLGLLAQTGSVEDAAGTFELTLRMDLLQPAAPVVSSGTCACSDLYWRCALRMPCSLLLCLC